MTDATPRPIARTARLITGAGTLRGLVDVQVGEILIRGVRIVAQDGQREWASLPQQQGRDGRWWPVVECADKALESAIKAEALREWRDLVGAAQ